MDVADRIFELADKKYTEQQEFAKAIGVTPSRVSEWRRKSSKSYMKRLTDIAKELNTTTEYLLTGKKEAHTDYASVGPVEREIIDYLQKLTPKERDLIRAQIQGILSSRGQ